MRRAERKHEWLICCGEVSLTAPQKRNHPKGGFFFCVHFTPQSRFRLDGRSVSGLLLFMSTPQSIAKPSPGWNKVALLTAVRNSPCSCPFSVSLHPPLAALNSEPRPGSLFIANQKLSPRAGKVARSAERGAAKNSRMPRVIPPQLRLRSAAPPQAVAPFYAAQARRAVPYPFAERSYQYPHSTILYTCSRQRSLLAITPSASLESSCAR